MGKRRMTEQELLIDCLQRLNQVGAAYMLTGSMASNYWGIPRTTHDLDFVLRLPRSSIPTLASAFADSFLLQESAIESGASAETGLAAAAASRAHPLPAA